MNADRLNEGSLSYTLLQARKQLAPFSDSAQIDCECLLTHVLAKPRTYLYTHGDQVLSASELVKFTALLQRRIQGEPVAYLIGKRDFWSLSLSVSPATLIPRPETELLVERALCHLKNIPNAKVLELGTGSGAIALSIAQARPDCSVTAVDISDAALKIAQHNAVKNESTHVNFFQSDWFSKIPQGELFHLIVSNPPYLEADSPYLEQGDVRFEPRLALVSGITGLEAATHLIHTAIHYLYPNGFLCLEHGYTQKKQLWTILKQSGYTAVNTFIDQQGHDRVTEACLRGEIHAQIDDCATHN